VTLPYPQRNYVLEFLFAWLWVLIDAPRLFLASKGNKTEQVGPLLFSFILALPVLGLYIYYIRFQTYVLKLDVFLNTGALVFMGLQV
ncbi:uncharacterized protein HaLaN_27086, partial [Haematococcus lacustris]